MPKINTPDKTVQNLVRSTLKRRLKTQMAKRDRINAEIAHIEKELEDLERQSQQATDSNGSDTDTDTDTEV